MIIITDYELNATIKLSKDTIQVFLGSSLIYMSSDQEAYEDQEYINQYGTKEFLIPIIAKYNELRSVPKNRPIILYIDEPDHQSNQQIEMNEYE